MRFLIFILISTLCQPLWAAQSTRLETLHTYSRVSLLSLRGHMAEAKEACEAAYKGAPDSHFLTQRLASYSIQEKDLKSASRIYREFADSHPESLQAHLSYATFLRHHSPSDKVARDLAISATKKALELSPDNLEANSLLIQLFQDAGEPDQALKIARPLIESGALPFNQSYSLLRSLLPRAEQEKGLTDFARQAADSPQISANDVLSLSEHFRQQGDLTTAIDVLKRHCTAQPNSLAHRTRLAILYFINKEPEVAVAELQEVVRIDSRQAKAHRSLAKHFLKTDQADKALPHRHAVLTISGGSPEEFTEVSDAFLASGDTSRGLALLRDARFYYPEAIPPTMRLAEALMANGQTAEASRLFREAESLAKNSIYPEDEALLNADFQLNFAKNLASVGDYASAEARIRSALDAFSPEQSEQSADALTLMAQMWIDQKKNLSAARSLLRRAQQIHPTHANSAELLKVMNSTK